MIGFALVFSASLGICAALNLQKFSHVRNTSAVTGQPEASFLTLPMWWAGVILNIVSEILNLAALGYAPATLVTPLGCLTVVFNAIANPFLYNEPFLKRDMLGMFFIFVGVVLCVGSQIGAPSPPITPESLRDDTLKSVSFWILVAGVLGGLLVLYVGFHKKYALQTCWIYLAESSLVSTFTVVAARCFASFCPPPMPGKIQYFYQSPDCWFTWGSLLVLCVSAVCGLLLQNAALMHFNPSEVVPIYFSMFALSGVAGSGLAYGEIRMPYALMLFPGVAFCILGVFAISHKRDERIAQRIARTQSQGATSALYDPPHGGGGGLPPAGCGGAAGGAHDGFVRHTGGASGRCSADHRMTAERASRISQGVGADSFSRGVSVLSEACSVASKADSEMALEETSFLAIGGGSFASFSATHRMGSIGAYPAAQLGGAAGGVERATTGSSTGSLPGVAHQGLSGRALLAHHAATEAAGDAMMGGGGLGAGAREALLPRCSEASSEGRSGTWRPPGEQPSPDRPSTESV